MSRCGINTRIVDKRGTKVFNGQADGLQSRSLEIFDSFGFADRVWKESNHMLEICLWVGTFHNLDHFTAQECFVLICCSDLESGREWEDKAHRSYSGHDSRNFTVCLGNIGAIALISLCAILII